MQRSFLLSAAFLAAFAAAGVVRLPAQQPGPDTPPAYRGPSTHVDGVFIPPVEGVPFQATVVIESQQTLPDGTKVTKRTINLIARDSLGRIHNERRRMMPESFHGTPPLSEVHLFDPETRMSTLYDPMTRVARQRELPDAPRMAEKPLPKGGDEDLGTTMMNGVEAAGMRHRYTVPAAASATGAAVEVVTETWYSEALHMNLLVRHSDPRTGVQTVGLSGIQRDEPPAEMFEVPQGYKVVDVTPPPVAPAGSDDGVTK